MKMNKKLKLNIQKALGAELQKEGIGDVVRGAVGDYRTGKVDKKITKNAKKLEKTWASTTKYVQKKSSKMVNSKTPRVANAGAEIQNNMSALDRTMNSTLEKLNQVGRKGGMATAHSAKQSPDFEKWLKNSLGVSPVRLSKGPGNIYGKMVKKFNHLVRAGINPNTVDVKDYADLIRKHLEKEGSKYIGGGDDEFREPDLDEITDEVIEKNRSSKNRSSKISDEEYYREVFTMAQNGDVSAEDIKNSSLPDYQKKFILKMIGKEEISSDGQEQQKSPDRSSGSEPSTSSTTGSDTARDIPMSAPESKQIPEPHPGVSDDSLNDIHDLVLAAAKKVWAKLGDKKKARMSKREKASAFKGIAKKINSQIRDREPSREKVSRTQPMANMPSPELTPQRKTQQPFDPNARRDATPVPQPFREKVSRTQPMANMPSPELTPQRKTQPMANVPPLGGPSPEKMSLPPTKLSSNAQIGQGGEKIFTPPPFEDEEALTPPPFEDEEALTPPSLEDYYKTPPEERGKGTSPRAPVKVQDDGSIQVGEMPSDINPSGASATQERPDEVGDDEAEDQGLVSDEEEEPDPPKNKDWIRKDGKYYEHPEKKGLWRRYYTSPKGKVRTRLWKGKGKNKAPPQEKQGIFNRGRTPQDQEGLGSTNDLKMTELTPKRKSRPSAKRK